MLLVMVYGDDDNAKEAEMARARISIDFIVRNICGGPYLKFEFGGFLQL